MAKTRAKAKRKVPALEKRVLDHMKRAAKEDAARHRATDALVGKFRSLLTELLDQVDEVKNELDTTRDKAEEVRQAVVDSALELRTDHEVFRRDLEKMHRRMGALRNVVLKYIPKGESV